MEIEIENSNLEKDLLPYSKIKNKFILERFTELELIKLAESNLCPHIKFIHPLRKEIEYLFYIEELVNWIKREFLVLYNQIPSYSYKFCNYDKEELKINLKDSIPQELYQIKDLYKIPLEIIDGTSGIYFLCEKSKIVYIGRAEDVFFRVNSHIRERNKEFDSAYFVRCPLGHLIKLEQILINFYKPKYNIKQTKGYTEKDIYFAKQFLDINFNFLKSKQISN